MTSKFILGLFILIGFILLSNVILGVPDADLVDRGATFLVELGQICVAELLEEMDDEDSTNPLRPTEHDNGTIGPIEPKYPRNPRQYVA